MTAYGNMPDGYLDGGSSHSPSSIRPPLLPRQNSRPFDPFGGVNTSANAFHTDDAMGSGRLDASRTAFNSMQATSMNGSHFPYDVGGAQTWNPAGNTLQSFGSNPLGLMGPIGSYSGNSRLKPSRGRTGLQNLWSEPGPPMQAFSTFDNHRLAGSQMRHDSLAENDDELIPTAIVIKNIPFAVKKEQLVQLMTDMGLPLPYAFNYHFDNGVFRGLAFANFTSADETAAVIQFLNHYELQGRKLRVEYKKMLPLQERERIEREKRERRGQLEEQHRPINPSQLHGQTSMSSMSSHLRGPSPSPLSQRAGKPDVDMNDKQTLEFYTELVMFRNDPSREVLIFPATLEPGHRRTIHTLAHHIGLMHVSRGNGEERQVHIYRSAPGTNTSPPSSSISGFPGNGNLQRGLSRSATTDFNEGRQADATAFNTLRGQSSVGLLGILDPSNNNLANAANLRAAKSFADLRSWTPSPVPSSASFPTALQTNGTRLQQLEGQAGSKTPSLTPTASNSGLGFGRDEGFLVSGMGSMNLGNGMTSSSSPRRQRNVFSPWDDGQTYPATAPIGSNRTMSVGTENNNIDRTANRANRGATVERGSGFRRQNGRGSDELRAGPPIIVE